VGIVDIGDITDYLKTKPENDALIAAIEGYRKQYGV
jgi:orotate phosphoribosyltransferase